MNRIIAASAVLLAVAVLGCGPTERTYSVVVHNDSPDPMTVVLTKDGPPMEPKWLPPEDFAAMLHAPAELKVNGVVVPPGKTADQTRAGKFDDGTRAILRVYHGKQTFETMLGIGPDSSNRTDLPLAPGANEIRIGPDGKAVRQ